MTPREMRVVVVVVQFSFCSVGSAFVLCNNQFSLQTGIACRLAYEGYWATQKIVLCTVNCIRGSVTVQEEIFPLIF